MLSSVTLDDSTGSAVTFHADTTTGKRWLTSALGLRGIANIRQSKRVRPQAHGGINESKYEDGRTITLVGEIMSTVSIEDALSEFATVAAPMMATLDVGPALMKWTEGASGNQLQRLVKLDGDFEPIFQEGIAALTYQAQFFAEDPRAYSQTLSQVSSSFLVAAVGGLIWPVPFNWAFNPGAAGLVTVTQAGNRPTPPIFRIHGAVTNPAIVRASNQRRISLIGSVATGDYVDVDIAKRTMKLNGSTNLVGFLDSANTDWRMEIPAAPTSETYNLTAQANDSNAYLDIFYRSAYA